MVRATAVLVGVLVAPGCLGAPPAAAQDTGTASSSGGSTSAPSSSGAQTSAGSSQTTTSTAATSTTSGSSSDTGFATGSTGGMGTPLFFDDFNRADSNVLGNGWIEKTPSGFRIEGGEVHGDPVGLSFTETVFYRDFPEAQLDIEMSIEFRVFATPTSVSPQLHARIQGDIANNDAEDAYLAYIPSLDTLTVSRYRAPNFEQDWTTPLTPPLTVGGLYRLRFRVTGTSPVQLWATLEESDGVGGWMLQAEVVGSDTEPNRIASPGTFGSSGSRDLDEISYDNFGAWIPNER